VSAQAITPTPPTDAAAASTRIAQIDQLIAQSANGFAPVQAAGGGTVAPAFSDVLATASSAAPPSTAASAGAYAPLIDAAAARYGISPAILTALIHQESGFNPGAVSPAGAEGLTQVMPENFAADGITNPFDPAQSINGGAKQLSADLSQFGGNVTDALAAYNAGSAAVTRYGGVPPYAETQNYVKDVLAYAQQYESQQTAVVGPPAGLNTAAAVSVP